MSKKVKRAIPAHITARMSGGGYISTAGKSGGNGLQKHAVVEDKVWRITGNGAPLPYRLERFIKGDSKMGWVLISDDPTALDGPNLDYAQENPQDHVLQGSSDLAVIQREWWMLVCSYQNDKSGLLLNPAQKRSIVKHAKACATKGVPFSLIPRVNTLLAHYIATDVIDFPLWTAQREQLDAERRQMMPEVEVSDDELTALLDDAE